MTSENSSPQETLEAAANSSEESPKCEETILATVANGELAQEADQEILDEDPAIDEDAVRAMSIEQKAALVEALLFAFGEPLSIAKLSDVTKIEETDIEIVLAAIKEKFKSDTCGFELVCVAEQFQFRTKSRFSQFVRALKASAPRRLSNAALETVSIVAYRQPIVKSDIERIRGVDATPTLKTLLERNLIKIVGHQQTVGQPALYGTTDDFLKLFGLSSLSELPTLRDLQELEKDPGETEEEPVQEAVVAQ